MYTMEIIREFFGWCAVINLGVLLMSSIILITVRGAVVRFHGNMFHMDEDQLSRAYFRFLSQYKIAILVFNIVPYIALKIMG